MTAPQAPGQVRVLWRYDLACALRSPRGLLFLVFFGLFWCWCLAKLAGGYAHALQRPDAGIVASYFLDRDLVKLFAARAPTLTAFFFFALSLTPLFAMMGACDQTANDIGSKHLRFLIPRVGRGRIFVARFLGALSLVSAAQLLAGLAAVVVALAVDAGSKGGDPASILSYGALVVVSLLVYSVPFVALMSIVSSALASAGLAALVAIGGYGVLAIALSFLPDGPGATAAAYLLPSGVKPWLLQPSIGTTLLGIGLLLGYAGCYLALGWLVFKRRDT